MSETEFSAWKLSEWSRISDHAVQETLKLLKTNAPSEYAQLEADPSKKGALIKASKEAADEQVKLAREFEGKFTDDPKDIEVKLRKHLSEDRLTKLHGALEIPTFLMNIEKQKDGNHLVKMTRNDKEFFPAVTLLAAADIDWTKLKQWASIIVEGVMLVMSAVGINVSPGEKAVEEAVEETVRVLQASTKFERAMEAFLKAWNSAGGSAYQKAKALFFLIKNTYAAGLLWTIIKSICKSMHWYDWLLTSAKVTAMIIAALATEGAALIAEIALIILGAVDFARKIANSNHLLEIKKTI